MPKLPDAMDLGLLPVARSGRGVATYDTSAAGRGLEALGGSVAAGAQAEGAATQQLANAGSRAAGVALSYEEDRQKKADELNEAKATSDFLVRKTQVDAARDEESDPTVLKGFKNNYQNALDQSAAVFTDPKKQELFKLKYQPVVEAGHVASNDRAFEVQKDASIADTNRQLGNLQDAGLKAKDEATKMAIVKSGQALINKLEEGEYIDKTQAEKLRQNWVQGYAVKAVSAMRPEDRINLLREAPKDKDAVLDRIGGVESGGNPNARASTSSALGTFQFTKGTWADMIAANRPDLAKGRSVAELTNDPLIQNLRTDPKLSREMAGALLDRNGAQLKAVGLEATPGNLYLAHFLGPGDAIKVLKAAPGTPVTSVVNADSIDANQSVLAGKTVDTVTNWANRKMGGTAPAAPQFGSYDLPPKEANLIEYHRDNLRNGTYLDNKGDISTVYITGVTGPDGKIYNVPGYWDGKLHTDVNEISDHAAQIGWDKWPSYANGKQADAAAERVHKVVESDTEKFRAAKSQKSGVHDFIPEALKPQLADQAYKDMHADDVDAQRAAKAQADQAKAVSDQVEMNILKDIYGDKPTMTVRDIVNNPQLTREAKERMITRAQSALTEDKTDKTYGKGFFSAYQAVHAADGTEGKITDPAQLYARVGPNGDLTVAGVDKLVTEINARKTPEGTAEGLMKAQFLKNAKAQISGADEGLKIPDPKGEQLYLKWLAQALPAYEAAKKAGKTPAQLVDPDSPDYIGKSITQFKRPMSEWYADMIQGGATPAAAAPAAFDISKVQSLDDLVAAYRSGKVSKTVADQLAIERGWGMRKTSAAPSGVPVSQ